MRVAAAAEAPRTQVDASRISVLSARPPDEAVGVAARLNVDRMPTAERRARASTEVDRRAVRAARSAGVTAGTSEALDTATLAQVLGEADQPLAALTVKRVLDQRVQTVGGLCRSPSEPQKEISDAL
jgi:hypothetical protein